MYISDDGLNGQIVRSPATGGVVIGPGLADTYGLRVSNAVTVTINGIQKSLEVVAVAANAKSASIYMDAGDLTELAGLPGGAYNGMLRQSAPGVDLPAGTQVLTQADRAKQLERKAVSNNVSGLSNQVTGVLVGCILIFLALYINFQDNTRDMLILHSMGYRSKAIGKLLVNVYHPIICAAFFITLAPSIWLGKIIQHALSISTNEYAFWHKYRGGIGGICGTKYYILARSGGIWFRHQTHYC